MTNILLDCERMRYEHTGLYHFCLQLGKAIERNIDKHNERLTVYAPPAVENLFDNNTALLQQQSSHKFIFPATTKYDVWHGTFQSSNYAPTSRKLKKVLTIHDLNFLYEHTPDKKRIRKSLRKIQEHINNADHICTISAYVKADVLKHLTVAGKPVSVIYNGCNINKHQKVSTPQMMPPSPFIFTIGTIMEKKNFHVLPVLLKDNDYQLIIAGVVQDVHYVEKIKKSAAAIGVSDRLIFTGTISENDKQWYLENCMAFAFPSVAEGFGLPVIEAMAFGKPVFLSNATSLPEIGGDVAYYFNSFEAEQMQHVFTEGLQHYHTTQQQQKIIERAALFSWDEAASKYLSIYSSLVNGIN